MNDKKEISVNGIKVNVGKVKHWRYAPESIAGTLDDRWDILEQLKTGWDNLDANLILKLLSKRFSYGSYWVKDSLDREGYREYLPPKFNTIKKCGSAPKSDIVVLYEGLVANQYPYALRLTQGETTALLTVTFDEEGISSLYMTDPDIYTYEPTFRKGGLIDENGEPLCFRHKCENCDVGREMTANELQKFVVDTIIGLFKDSNAEIVYDFKYVLKEFPNIIIKSGCDILYHRIDIANHQSDRIMNPEKTSDYIEMAKKTNAIPLVMPVAFWCSDTL